MISFTTLVVVLEVFVVGIVKRLQNNLLSDFNWKRQISYWLRWFDFVLAPVLVVCNSVIPGSVVIVFIFGARVAAE